MRPSKPAFLGAVFGLLTLALVSLTAHSQAFAANESVLWSFGNGSDGQSPFAGLIMDKSGNLFGTTANGGTYYNGASDEGGTVFELTPPSTSGGNWNESILWNFGNGTDGQDPLAGLIMDTSGNLYGTTNFRGAYGTGTVFKLAPPSTSGGNWTESILWNFGSSSDGAFPVAGLIMDTSGNLYGTTQNGGAYGNGTVFKLAPPSTSGGNWTESILWNFGGGTAGAYSDAGLIVDTSGNLYGTTIEGGAYGGAVGFGGTAFELQPPSTGGGNWTETILWNFGNGTDGMVPTGLIMDTSGNLYGTTIYGGAYSVAPIYEGGTVFELTPPSTSGGNWTESILWNFQDDNSTDPFGPLAGLSTDTSGNLYGTTCCGGANATGGTVFELTAPLTGGGIWTESILWSFGKLTDGVGPWGAGVIVDRNGNLYGATRFGGAYGYGTAFEVSNIGPTTPSPTPSASSTPTALPPTPTPTSTPTPTPTPTSVLTISPTKLNFGNIDATASSKPKKLTLNNKGTAAAAIGQLVPPASFTIASDGCSNQTIQPKGKCAVEVTFAPATVVGAVNEALMIPYNGASPSETLEGNGIAVTLKAPSSKTLPGAAAGSIGKAANITIANRNAAAVQLGAASALTDFTITADGCANVSLAPKTSCVVTVAFAPPTDATGALSSVLSYDFTYGANGGSVATTLKGTVK